MTHIRPVSRCGTTPAPAASLLEKSVRLGNAMDAVAMLRELPSLFAKSDVHDN